MLHIHSWERRLVKKIQAVDPLFQDLPPVYKFAYPYLMTSTDEQKLTWVGKFVRGSFEERENYMQLWEMIHSVL